MAQGSYTLWDLKGNGLRAFLEPGLEVVGAAS